jgi:hypothetical protein
LGGLDDGRGSSVFDAAAGVGPFYFAEELDVGEVGGEVVETQKGRWAEAVMAFIESMSGDVRELDYGKDESGSDV